MGNIREYDIAKSAIRILPEYIFTKSHPLKLGVVVDLGKLSINDEIFVSRGGKSRFSIGKVTRLEQDYKSLDCAYAFTGNVLCVIDTYEIFKNNQVFDMFIFKNDNLFSK